MSETAPVVTITQVTVYDAVSDADAELKKVRIDTDYATDEHGRVRYFNLDEAAAYLSGAGRSLPSLPLLLNIYVALSEMAAGDEAAARLLEQLNSAWDRCGTIVFPADGRIVHSDSVLGERVVTGLTVPEEGDAISELFPRHPDFFKALLGVRDPDRFCEAAAKNGKLPFYWYPRGERRAMFGGGDFYYMHNYIPGLLMVFCDDEPHPRRVLRSVSY